MQQHCQHLELTRLESVGPQQTGERTSALVVGQFAAQSADATLGFLSKPSAFFTRCLGVGKARTQTMQIVTKVEHLAELSCTRGRFHRGSRGSAVFTNNRLKTLMDKTIEWQGSQIGKTEIRPDQSLTGPSQPPFNKGLHTDREVLPDPHSGNISRYVEGETG